MRESKENKAYVKIQSSMTIRVASGHQYQDFTKKDSDIPNRLKVAPKWQDCMCLIKQGQHVYPAEIADWHSVKALQSNGTLTIGAFVDSVDDAEVIESKKQISNAMKSLADLAGGNK